MGEETKSTTTNTDEKANITSPASDATDSSKVENNMVNCKTCGAEIAKSAKTCPKCGAKNNKPINKLPLAIALISVILLVLLGVIIGSSRLTGNQKYAYNVISKYKNNLKNPDSMILRGDVLYATTAEGDQYVVFNSSGSNSYGATMTSVSIYCNDRYMGEYGDDSDDIEDLDDRIDFLGGVIIWTGYQEYGNDFVKHTGSSFTVTEFDSFSGKKIASKLGCEWKE